MATPNKPASSKTEAQQREEDRRLAELQTAAARQRRIEKAARRDPATQELLDEVTALKAAISELQAKNKTLQDDNAALREQLAAALRPKR
jgi:predicted FMN-binding regulatory protein PaiB